jgi:hypothetical protein
MIPKYQGVGVMAIPSTGFFALAAARHPLASLVHECTVHHRERQKCQHPEAELLPHAPISAIELLELDHPQEIAQVKTRWVIAHWNETRSGDKVGEGPWESFQLFLQFDEKDAREQFGKSYKLWRKHGYFCLPEYDDYLRKKATKQLMAMTAKRIINGSPVLKPTPSNSAMGLTKAQLAVLEPILPMTVGAVRDKDNVRAIAAFEFESRFRGTMEASEEIDYCIVRAYTRQGPLPTDEEIAKEIAGYGLPKLTPGAIKQRRFKLELYGRNPGPKPRVVEIG